MNFTRVIRRLALNLKNIPGPSVNKKIVVIECDDWGGIRTPSKEVYRSLVKKGIVEEDCRYGKDTLASTEDMESLYHVLESVKDSSGKPAVMTPMVNVANPDFEKIKASGFTEYHFEKFTDTLIKYGREPKVFDLWKAGIEKGIFVPELHGREHLTSQLWLEKLKEGNSDVKYAFEQGYTTVNTDDLIPEALGFRAEFYFNAPNQLPFLKDAIKSGVQLFADLFGQIPKVFAPSNGIFHPMLEREMAEAGLKYINVLPIGKVPDENGTLQRKLYLNGKLASSGLRYYYRNCVFEPSDNVYDGLNLTLRQIEVAFKRKKPAIISTHRVNFIGAIDPDNREYGLTELKKLLKEILKRWPDVDFMSSIDMFNIMYKKHFS